jgi:hypothetical protein
VLKRLQDGISKQPEKVKEKLVWLVSYELVLAMRNGHQFATSSAYFLSLIILLKLRVSAAR